MDTAASRRGQKFQTRCDKEWHACILLGRKRQRTKTDIGYVFHDLWHGIPEGKLANITNSETVKGLQLFTSLSGIIGSSKIDSCAGPIPLIPKYSLGLWWSKYWTYTDKSLKKLVLDFEEHEFPLSVICIDMDWHITQIEQGSAWTGYTWNRKLFPDPKELISWLHSKGLKVVLNLHPADGCQPHEVDRMKSSSIIFGRRFTSISRNGFQKSKKEREFHFKSQIKRWFYQYPTVYSFYSVCPGISRFPS